MKCSVVMLLMSGFAFSLGERELCSKLVNQLPSQLAVFSHAGGVALWKAVLVCLLIGQFTILVHTEISYNNNWWNAMKNRH